jgi:hypothetical protein
MSEPTRIFNIGETVWIARYGMQEFHDPCLVCFGKLSVTVILGNSESVETPCSYCGLGHDGPRGWTTEYRIEPAVEKVTITGREIREGESTEIIYYGPGGHCYQQAVTFETEAEALAESVKLCEKETNSRETRAAWIKKDKVKSFAWNTGYHLREAKRLREQITYHERMAVLCKAKEKP